ncbi:MAG: hypothetical protein ACXWUG_21185 [Polyangiales bacterium]
MIHSSYKSLLVAFAVALSFGGVGCAIAPEGESAQTSSDLTIEHGDLKPEVDKPNVAVTAVAPAQQNVVVHPTVPHLLAGPKPNPWDDNGTNGNTGTGGSGTGTGTGTGSNNK